MKYINSKHTDWISRKNYTKKILLDFEDFQAEGHVLQVAIIPPHTKSPLHYHNQQSEGFYILEGEAVIQVNGVDYIVRPGDAMIVEPKDTHSLENKTDQDFKLLVFKINAVKDSDDSVWLEEK